MAEFPALPLWTDAYLADCSHLTDAEHGRYLLMLMQLWRMPMQKFPNDDAWLARKFGRSEQDFVLQWKPLMQEFMQSSGNWWMQKRLSAEWQYVSQLSQKRSAAAKSMWEKKKGLCTSNAPTPTPTPLKKVVVAAAAEKAAAPTRATRWRADVSVPIDWIVMAGASRAAHRLPEIDLALEAEKFSNFWTGKSGKDATKLDWRKTWINWALGAKGQTNGHGTIRQSAHDKFFTGVADAIAETLRPPSEGGDNVVVGPFGRPLLPP